MRFTAIATKAVCLVLVVAGGAAGAAAVAVASDSSVPASGSSCVQVGDDGQDVQVSAAVCPPSAETPYVHGSGEAWVGDVGVWADWIGAGVDETHSHGYRDTFVGVDMWWLGAHVGPEAASNATVLAGIVQSERDDGAEKTTGLSVVVQGSPVSGGLAVGQVREDGTECRHIAEGGLETPAVGIYEVRDLGECPVEAPSLP